MKPCEAFLVLDQDVRAISYIVILYTINCRIHIYARMYVCHLLYVPVAAHNRCSSSIE